MSINNISNISLTTPPRKKVHWEKAVCWDVEEPKLTRKCKEATGGYLISLSGGKKRDILILEGMSKGRVFLRLQTDHETIRPQDYLVVSQRIWESCPKEKLW